MVHSVVHLLILINAPVLWILCVLGSGHSHPKVGVILTGVALMYRNKAKRERSSSILIQEVRNKLLYTPS